MIQKGARRIDEDFLKNTMQIFKSPILTEIENELSVKLPRRIDNIFTKSCDLYNSKKVDNPYEIVRNRDKLNNCEYFYNLLHMGVQNGLAAVYYNFNSFINYCTMVREKGKELLKSVKPSPPISLAISTQKIIFEYEHFTLHLRIVLDRLNYFLNYYFKTDTRNLYKFYYDIKQRYTNDQTAKRILEVIDKHRNFLDEQISTDKSKKRTERDRLAHREEIQFTTVNIMAIQTGEVEVKLLTRDIQYEIEAEDIIKERLNNLTNFIEDLLNSFFVF